MRTTHHAHCNCAPFTQQSVKYKPNKHIKRASLSSMGCCGEEDDGIFKQLIPAGTLETSIETIDFFLDFSDSVISPMNSNFSALVSPDILQNIFERLPMSDLGRAACVCRIWNSVASDRDLLSRAFKSPWKLKDVIGIPSSGGFWKDNGIGRFAISHRLVRGDTVAGLAVKYSVQVTDIKRVNNMMSDHGIYSRERLLIPITKPDILLDGTCYIELDAYAKREVAVLYLEGEPDGKVASLRNGSTTGRGKRRILDSMRRVMKVDDETAEYYLSISNGNLRAAFSEFSEDHRWESSRQGRDS